MKKTIILLIALAFLGLPTMLSATLIDVNTLGLSIDELVEGATFSGATFTSENLSLKYMFVGGSPAYYGLSGDAGASADIYIDFSIPITSLSVTMGDGGCTSCDQDAFSVSVYDFDTDLLISTTNSPIFGGNGLGYHDEYTILIVGDNIGRVVIDPGNSGNLPGTLFGYGGVALSQIEFMTTVPEPSTILLLGAGLVGLAGVARRKLKK